MTRATVQFHVHPGTYGAKGRSIGRLTHLDGAYAAYELFSVVLQAGTLVGGHYTAYIKDFATGRWSFFDDNGMLLGESRTARVAS